MEAYKECKSHIETKINEMMKKQQIQLPDEIDKNQFLTAANFWEH